MKSRTVDVTSRSRMIVTLRRIGSSVLLAMCLFGISSPLYGDAASISIGVAPDAGTIERLAAAELSEHLSKIYPDFRFPVEPGFDGRRIMVGLEKQLEPDGRITSQIPDHAEGFLIEPLDDKRIVIVSKTAPGLIYGVYQLLETLGCRFFLDTEHIPEHEGQPDLNAWKLKNEPLVSERYANPWEVYLEGCSSWDMVKWKQYIRNIQRMGFNSILVHAYGNNPMFTFTFNGKTKTVGYLTSSAKGRNWGQKHVNDVRRMPGGKSLFKGSVFTSEIAMVPDDERIERTQAFMGEIFEYAAGRGVKVNFAHDFDIFSNIPQDVVMTLPESDRYQVTHKGIG